MVSRRWKKDVNSILYLYTGGLSTGRTVYFTSANNCVEFISCAHEVSQRKNVVLCSSHSAALLQAREGDSIPDSELSSHNSISHQLQLLYSIRQNYMGHALGCKRRRSNDSFLFYQTHMVG
jgi:hypothetical protein